jgi:hypothetical protein
MYKTKYIYRVYKKKKKKVMWKYRACLVRVFVFCFDFVTFYFIEVRTLILI